MKLALNQAKRIALILAIALAGFGMAAPSAARAEQVYYYKDAKGVFQFTRTPVPGAKPFHPQRFGKKAAPRETRSDTATRRAPARPRRGASNAAYDHIIFEYAERYEVDAALVKAIIHAESSFRPKARSRVGARGLMQLMPSTAGMYGVASRHLYDPRSNIHAGVRHLRRLLRTFGGDTRLAVAAYNAGAGAVKRHRGLPPYRETRNYVRKVLRFHARYASEVVISLRGASDESAAASPS